jgi:carbonic anhydrase
MSYDSPVNIDSNVQRPCQGLCSLSFKYSDTLCTANKITDGGGFQAIVASYEPNSETVVTYKGIVYRPVALVIYNKSLHKYDGAQTDGELHAYHVGTGGEGAGKTLIISIPIQQGDSATTIGSQTIDTILKTMPASSITKESSSSSPIAITFKNDVRTYNLKTIIPSKTPFYAYVGNAPYSTTSATINYVVFPRSASLYVSQSAMDNFKAIVKPVAPPVAGQPSNTVTYNGTGANSGASGSDDNLYIQCSPAGDDGVILYKQGLYKDGSTTGDFKQAEMATGDLADANFLESEIFILIVQFVIAAFLAFIIVYVAYLLYKAFAGGTSAPAVPASKAAA